MNTCQFPALYSGIDAQIRDNLLIWWPARQCSGQAAALAGGTTMHIDFGLPTDHDLEQGFKDYQQKTQKAVMDFGLHMAVTRFDAKVPPSPLASLPALSFCCLPWQGD